MTTWRAFISIQLAMIAAAAVGNGGWADDMKIGGDLRYRHERTDKDGSDAQTRHRVRARFGLRAAVNSDLDTEIRLATGSTAPYTSDQTLDESFRSKSVNLDRAYFDWHPAKVDRLHIIGGKMANPFFTGKGLIWDSDVTPEGLAATYTVGSDRFSVHVKGAGFWAEERSADEETMIYEGQMVAESRIGELGILAGGGICTYEGMKGYPVLVDDLKGFGNSTVAVTDESGDTTQLLYADDYSIVECFVQASAKCGAVPCKGTVHGVVNTEADSDDTGWLVGLRIGQAKEPGSLQVDYDWREVEKNAVVGALTDSNVWGGGADGRGHQTCVTYQIAQNWRIALVCFVSEIGLDDSVNYEKFRAELKAKF